MIYEAENSGGILHELFIIRVCGRGRGRSLGIDVSVNVSVDVGVVV